MCIRDSPLTGAKALPPTTITKSLPIYSFKSKPFPYGPLINSLSPILYSNISFVTLPTERIVKSIRCV